jgi:hypothetical protein
LNRWALFIIFCFILSLATDISYAAGMLMRVQQMKQQRQQQGQGMTPEQYQQYQEYQEQQQGDQGQQAPAQPTYQQLVDQRNQAIAQAILNAHNQAVSAGSQETGSVQAQQQTLSPGVVQPPPAVVAGSTDAKDVVDLSEVWKKLDTKSTVWPLLIDDQAKLMTVSEYIDRFQKEGVKIKQSPMHYVQMIDQITSQNPEMLQRPFGELVQILAIIDYDFDNGMDKDTLARKVLGEAGFESNKKRFTQQQQPQQ